MVGGCKLDCISSEFGFKPWLGHRARMSLISQRFSVSRHVNAGYWQNGRRGDLMISVLDSGLSSTGLSPSQGHCVVFLVKTLYSHSASLHPGV